VHGALFFSTFAVFPLSGVQQLKKRLTYRESFLDQIRVLAEREGFEASMELPA